MSRLLYICMFLVTALTISACSSTGGSTIEGEGDLHIQPEGDKLARTNVQLGVGYMKRGKYEFALNKLRKAIDIDESLPDAHYAIALLYERLSKPAHAERHYRRAIELNPQYSDARNAYGVFLCRDEQYENADRQFTEALKNPLYKTPLQAMLNAGVCLMKSNLPNRFSRAEDYFRKVLQRGPRVAEALINMSKLSVQQGNYLVGRAYLQRYLEVGKHTPESLWLGIQIERNLGDYKALNSYTTQLQNDFPDSEEASKLDRSSR